VFDFFKRYHVTLSDADVVSRLGTTAQLLELSWFLSSSA